MNQVRGNKEDVFNKVKFSSAKLGETKQGSPSIGLYMKRDQLERFVALATELLENTDSDGCKLSCVIIPGKEYDSGYMYVNPKEPRKENRQEVSRNEPKKSFGNKNQAREFFNSKRINDTKEA
jgi:hypothetical protein